jgi:hypothetical protein
MRNVTSLDDISNGYMCYEEVTDKGGVRRNSDKTLWKLKCMVDCLFIPAVGGEYNDSQFAVTQRVIKKFSGELRLNSSHRQYYP